MTGRQGFDAEPNKLNGFNSNLLNLCNLRIISLRDLG